MTTHPTLKYWLLKTEPTTFSIDDLSRRKRERWDGVRNFQARNNLRAMKKGDVVFIYHSSIKEPAIVGIGKIIKEAYPDPTQFEIKSPYFDDSSNAENPRWTAVDVAYVSTLDTPLTLSTIKSQSALKAMEVARRGSRLSVLHVTEKHAKLIQAYMESGGLDAVSKARTK